MSSSVLEMLTDESDIAATGCKRTALGCPPKTILEDPGIEVVFLFFGQAKTWVSNTLQDVVVVLRGPEHRWRRVGNIPTQ